MWRKVVLSGLILFALVVAQTPFPVSPRQAHADPGVIYVPDDFASIQAAVDAAQPGDTIMVRDGTYTENVDVAKPLTIISENGPAVTAVLSADTLPSIFWITADNVHLEGFSLGPVEGGASLALWGVYADGVDHATILNLNITQFERCLAGMQLINTTDSFIGDNTVASAEWGILLDGYSSGNRVVGNTLMDNSSAIAAAGSSQNNTFTRNTISGSSTRDFWIDDPAGNTIYLNDIMGDAIQSASPATTFNSPSEVTYSYRGASYTSYLGNYWSTYTGSDGDGDGIGDTPQPIRGADADNYPLMERFGNYIMVEDTTRPTPVTDLAVTEATETSVTLSWTAPGDDGNSGTASLYDLRYATSPNTHPYWWGDATQCSDLPSPQQAGEAETFVVGNLSPQTEYFFALKTSDEAGNWSALSNVPGGTTTSGGPAVIYVPDDFASIQAAVDAAQPGDTIIVRDGTYTENVKVDRQLVIKSENGPDVTTVLPADPSDHIFHITADSVHLEGFSIVAAASSAVNLATARESLVEQPARSLTAERQMVSGSTGAQGSGSADLIISTVGSTPRQTAAAVASQATDQPSGVCLEASNHSTIVNNRLSVGYPSRYLYGIRLVDSSHNTIADNTSDEYVYIRSSPETTLIGNTVTSVWPYGIALWQSPGCILQDNVTSAGLSVGGYDVSDFNTHTIVGNSVSGKPIYYYANVTGLTVPEDAGEVVLANCSDMRVEHIDMAGSGVGIALAFTTDSMIVNNRTGGSSRFDLALGGIELETSSGNLISGNAIAYNHNAIMLRDSDNNTITGNSFSGNLRELFTLYGSRDNAIYLNNLDGTDVLMSPYAPNLWNSPATITYTHKGKTSTSYLGNYWSTYTGSDGDGDGIGDTPQPIRGADADNYPLMERFENYIMGGGDTTPPAPVTNLAVTGVTHNSVSLSWTAPGDDDTTGTAAEYDIRYSTSLITEANWEAAAQCSNVPSPQAADAEETFLVENLAPGNTYYFALKTKDEAGNWSALSNVPEGATSPLAPVTDLEVYSIEADSVRLRWSAPEIPYETASEYEIRYSLNEITEANWGTANQCIGEPDPRPAPDSDSYQVTRLATGKTHYFALKWRDPSGLWSGLSNVVTATTIATWSFAVITDIHIGDGFIDYGGEGWDDGEDDVEENSDATTRLKEAIGHINDNREHYNIGFVAVTGDLTNSAEMSELNNAKRMLGALDVPWVPLIGNHDVWPYYGPMWVSSPEERDEQQAPEVGLADFGPDQYFSTVFMSQYDHLKGLWPSFENGPVCVWNPETDPKHYSFFRNFSFDYNGFHFIGLDFNPRDNAFSDPDLRSYKGVSGEGDLYDFAGGTWDWFMEHLRQYASGHPESHENVILLAHHPLLLNPVTGFLPTEMAEVSLRLFGFRDNILAEFAGHTHEWNRVTPLRQLDIVETKANKDNPLVRVVRVYPDGRVDYSRMLPQDAVYVQSTCPVDLVLTDPDNLTISKWLNEIPGATYTEEDRNGDGALDDLIRIPQRKPGDYRIQVIPEPGASPTDTFTLEVATMEDTFGYTPIILAGDVPIGEIPAAPYTFESKDREVSQLTYAGDASGRFSDAVNLAAFLADEEGSPLAGRAVTFEIGGQAVSAVTDAGGRAATSLVLDQAASEFYLVRITFDGDQDYLPAFTSAPFEIQQEETVITVADQEGFTFGHVTLQAHITDDDGEPLPQGLEVAFRVGDHLIGVASTDEDGQATIDWNVDLIPGDSTETWALTVTFTGDDYRLSAEGAATFTLRSARWLKEGTVQKLEGAGTGDGSIDRDIEVILRHVRNSLDDDLWIDASHLATRDARGLEEDIQDLAADEESGEWSEPGKGRGRHGIAVFHEEHSAVVRLLRQLDAFEKETSRLQSQKGQKKKGQDSNQEEARLAAIEAASAVFQEVVGDLVAADMLLGKIAIGDARDTPLQDSKARKAVAHQMEQAEKELAKAEEELTKNRPDKAIMRLAKAWLHAQLAVRRAAS